MTNKGKPKFAAGDLVQLKSGSPVMTVEVENRDIYDRWDGTYSCSWFSGAKNNHKSFTEAALKAAVIEE